MSPQDRESKSRIAKIKCAILPATVGTINLLLNYRYITIQKYAHGGNLAFMRVFIAEVEVVVYCGKDLHAPLCQDDQEEDDDCDFAALVGRERARQSKVTNSSIHSTPHPPSHTQEKSGLPEPRTLKRPIQPCSKCSPTIRVLRYIAEV